MTAGPRYEPLVKLASGGMGTVWIGAARGALGFRQLVAIKRPHPELLEQPSARQELVEEARLASMIRHANVVDVRDVEEDGVMISLVMDFIEGASLGELVVAASRKPGPSTRLPARVVVRILADACAGLHAAHELIDERGRAVGLIHRDISPQNILVGEDGIARVTDFGVAKFARRDGSKSTTAAGTLKGKLAYMAPEYLRNQTIDRRADIFALGVVLWECLVGTRLFRAGSDADTFERVVTYAPLPVSVAARDRALAPLDDVVAIAVAKDANARFQNAAAMGAALQNAATAAGLMGTASEVAACLRELAGEAIARRRAEVHAKLAHEPSLASLGLAPMPTPVTVTEAVSASVDLADTIKSDPVLVATTLPLPTPRAQPIALPPAKRNGVPFVIAIAGVATLAGLGGAAFAWSSSRPVATPVTSANVSAPTVRAPPPTASPAAPAPPPPPETEPVHTASASKPKPVAPVPSIKRPPANPYE